MRTINQRIHEASDKHGFEVMSIASTEHMTISHFKKDYVYFSITIETDSEVSKIDKAMTDSYFKAKE